MKITIEIDDKIINDLTESGVDAGISYWASGFQRARNSRPASVRDRDSGKWHTLDLGRGLALMINKHARYLDPANLDAEAGDVFIQLCAFGEIKYG